MKTIESPKIANEMQFGELFENNKEIFDHGIIPFHVKKRTIEKETKEIPCTIIQHWHVPIANKIIPGMFHNCLQNIIDNPEFDFYFFDENSAKSFLQENFEKNIINAYLKLKPQSYKSDLLRLCAIYIHGGVYVDIKFRTVKSMIDYVKLNESMFAKNDWETKVFSGFFMTKPKDPIIKKCIERIVSHVENNYYGSDPHWPTGPGVWGDVMVENQYAVPNSIIHFVLEDNNIHSIIDKRTNETILRQYKTYREEQNKDSSHKYYWYSWLDGEIYNQC